MSPKLESWEVFFSFPVGFKRTLLFFWFEIVGGNGSQTLMKLFRLKGMQST